MKISKLRCLAVFGVVKDALTPTEHDVYKRHKKSFGKHFFGRMRRDFHFGLKMKSRKSIWRALQDKAAERTQSQKPAA